jgi:hypothetical protein
MLPSDRSAQYQLLRSQHKIFYFEGFTSTFTNVGLRIEFLFNIDGLTRFQPVSVFHFGKYKEIFLRNYQENKPLAEQLIFNIGLIELISYWKASCAPVIQVPGHSLSEVQVEWWKKLYFNGLGEFFYMNGLNPDMEHFVDIVSSGQPFEPQIVWGMGDGFLVPVGGGKDSAVTLELLKNVKAEIIPLIINPRAASIQTLIAAGIDANDMASITRTIDPELIRLNSLSYLNGHTPFSAMLAFYSLLASLLSGKGNIALSNESSANEATIPGTHINHQYSKSFAFEQDFRDYVNRYISPSFNYFSFLRPLNELQIVSVFSKLDHYHRVFKSCNVGSKSDVWCGECPKCLFTHIMLSAFKGKSYTDEILGAKMLDDREMSVIFDELCGFSLNKPFECVGTIDDVTKALQMIADQYNDHDKPLLVDRFLRLRKENFLPSYPEDISFNHNLSPAHLEILKNALL